MGVDGRLAVMGDSRGVVGRVLSAFVLADARWGSSNDAGAAGGLRADVEWQWRVVSDGECVRWHVGVVSGGRG
jgi:hypothetical protein